LDQKRFGKIILIIGFATLLTGIGLIIYSATVPNWMSLSTPQNTVPAGYATVIAATFAFVGIALLALGATQLAEPGWVDRWLNS
jgi:hypothetical protein